MRTADQTLAPPEASVYARIVADTAARCIPDGNHRLVAEHGWRGCFRNAEGAE